jgi:Tol biopolymer transport system component
MTRSTVFAALLAALVSAPVQAQRNGRAEMLLEAARQKETLEGDLKGAIRQYEEIVKRHPGDRAVAAKALIQMAECYQKLGDAESRKIYERVVKDYADQKEAVAIARAKLGGGATNLNSGVSTRQVWTGPKVDAYGTISPDGRFLSYTDWGTGDLALHDFTTGEDRHLTNKGSWSESNEWAFMSTISRDGKQVAYGWSVSESTGDLRLIDLNGGKPRVLVAAKSGVAIQPLDWSPDGKWLAVRVRRMDNTGEIGLVATADGAFRLLKPFGPHQYPPSRMSFSPDGKYLACDLPAADNPEQREIHLLAVDGGRETLALAQPANDRVAGWAPDGRLLFASERTGLTGIWAQVITDGKRQGMPELIKANINPYSLGLTRSGKLYYSVVSSAPDIYLASVDFETGKVLSGPTPLAQPYFGLNRYPQWSRDGKYLAYLSKRDANSRNVQLHILAIRSADTGKVRELTPNLMNMYPGNNYSQPVWSPDSGSVLVNGTDKQGRRGVYRIDTQNGDTTPVVLNDPGRQDVSARAWSPDARTLYIVRTDVKPKVETLCARDMQSGQEREILRRDALAAVALSPDGRRLAVVVFDRTGESLLAVPAEGGEPRELLHTPWAGKESLGVFAAWSPEGKYVIFRKGPAGGRETYRIPAEGGAAVKYGAEWSVGPPAINPDGRQVAFPMGQHKIEIWAMENFLPALASK